jgi:hypothetical protein
VSWRPPVVAANLLVAFVLLQWGAAGQQVRLGRGAWSVDPQGVAHGNGGSRDIRQDSNAVMSNVPYTTDDELAVTFTTPDSDQNCLALTESVHSYMTAIPSAPSPP